MSGIEKLILETTWTDDTGAVHAKTVTTILYLVTYGAKVSTE